MFAVFEKMEFEPAAGNSLSYDENTREQQSTCY